jgi:hypothetical protein
MKDGLEGTCIEHGRRIMHTGDWLEILKGGDHMEDMNIDMIQYKNEKVKLNLSLCTPVIQR